VLTLHKAWAAKVAKAQTAEEAGYVKLMAAVKPPGGNQIERRDKEKLNQ
jgi:hypothetical protein